MDIKRELGQKIKRIRKQRGITQEQLAEMADISLRTLGGIESGESFTSAQTLEKILICLNISLNELCDCEYLKTSDELVYEIITIVSKLKDNREKLEEIYKIIKAINTL